MPPANTDATTFGIACAAEDLDSAKDFYKTVYPDFERISEGVFGTIKYFSIVGKDGEVLIAVFHKQTDNPIQAAIPMLKVNSVAEFSAKLKSMGGKEVLPQGVCPCTNAYFAIWTDAFGNQMLIKEAKGSAAAHSLSAVS
jgi:predicted enzyme related to lactoylglutathione lyase